MNDVQPICEQQLGESCCQEEQNFGINGFSSDHLKGPEPEFILNQMLAYNQTTNLSMNVNPFEIRKTVDIKRLKDQLWQELETGLADGSSKNMNSLLDKLYNIQGKCD